MIPLPAELYRYIIRDFNLDTSDYYNLCLVDRAFSTEAFSALYTIFDPRPDDDWRMSLFVHTIINSPHLAAHIRVLILNTEGIAIFSAWRETISDLIKAINSMNNLRTISIDKNWDIDDRWRKSSELGFIPWTSRLILPQIKVLCIKYELLNPLHEIFEQLPSPLPLLEMASRTTSSSLDNIVALRCRKFTVTSVHPLNFLRHLETEDHTSRDVHRLGGSFTPELDTLICISGISLHENHDTWATLFSSFKKVKGIGPIRCSKFTINATCWVNSRYVSLEQVFSLLSRIRGLKTTALILSETEFDSFDPSQSLDVAKTAPSLRQVSLINSTGGLYEPTTFRIKIWKRLMENEDRKNDRKEVWVASSVEEILNVSFGVAKERIRKLFDCH